MTDLNSVDDFLDRIHAEHAARSAIRIAEMKVAGLEPCPGTGIVSIGMELFGISMRPVDGAKVEIRLNVVDQMVWGAPWPDRGTLFAMEDVLSAIVTAWPIVGQSHSRVGKGVGSATLAPVPLAGPAETLTLVHDGRHLLARFGETRIQFGRESVIVAQVLMTVADVLAERLPAMSTEVRDWKVLRQDVDLPPFPADGDAASDTLQEETAWFAGKAGIPIETYRLAALDVLARQILSSQDRERPEPRMFEWHPSHVPADLDPTTTLAISEHAASICGLSEDDFEEQALTTRNNEAFQRIFYGDGLALDR